MQTRPRRRGVPLVEDQVDHVQHRPEPLAALVARRHPERNPAGLDALLGAGDAPGHRRLRHQKRPGDLRRAQPTDRPQCQRDLRSGRQRGMTAQEQQDQCVVGVLCRARWLGKRPDRVLTTSTSLLTAQQIGQPARSDRDQPPTRILRKAVGRPLRRCRQQRLLHRVLRGVEVPEPPDDRAEHLRRQPAQQVLDLDVRHPIRAGTRRSAAHPRTRYPRRSPAPDTSPTAPRSPSPGRSSRIPRSSTRRAPPRSRHTARP